MLALDEEVDYIEYQRYLRTQSNADLFDILSHLDPAACPRRAESVKRELTRREILVEPFYDDLQNTWRKFVILTIAFLSLTLLLGLIMSPDEAISPQSPPALDLSTTPGFVQFTGDDAASENQLTVSVIGVYTAQVAENGLRQCVLVASKSGIYLLLCCLTLWKLVDTFRRTDCENALIIDLRRLLVIASGCQAMLFILSAVSSLPDLVHDGQPLHAAFLARAITVFVPWG